MANRLRIGTRGSVLALKQVEIVAAAFKAADSSVLVEVCKIQTQGDVNQQPIPLDTIGKGWFTKEIEKALLQKEIDLAVHSLKDMAADMPEGLAIGAYLAREDARDALITKNGDPIDVLKPGAVIGTDSARRQVQMLALRSDVVMQSLRGNVPKRLEKLTTENYDAVILAVAGLKRLGLENRITKYFDISEITPAPGQGVLAVQYAQDDKPLGQLLQRINDIDTAHVAEIERSFSVAVGGGCKSPTGAYARREGDDCVLSAMIVGKDGTILRDTMRAPWAKSHDLGEKLAWKLIVQSGHGANA